MTNRLLQGKLAFVTGAGSGIGRAVCQIFSREGATVIAADRNEKTAADTIKSFTAPSAGNDDHSSIGVEVDKAQSVSEALKESLSRYKRPPTIVVNSAGITRDNWLLEMSEMDYDDVLNVNLKGTFLVLQTFARAMVEAEVPEGSIINLSSITGRSGNLGQANYTASKAGVLALTMTAAKELGKKNIRVNAVLPGFAETPMSATIPDKVKTMIINKTSLNRTGTASEVAEVITFLASSKSSFVTGATIDVTGGLHA